MKVFLAICLTILVASASAATKEQWKSRTIYQLLTDRFARPDGNTSPCMNLSNYCGGGWAGITENLDYIANMGFDAIWISPIVENTPGGYHGYWAKDINALNSHFGSEEDFVNMVKACHEKDIWIMLDVVANHVGPVGFDFSEISPFNQSADYHTYCEISSEDFATHNMEHIHLCRLDDLPDLDQQNPYVAQTLITWIHDIVQKYDIDGLRIDTVPEVNKQFWSQFTQSAGVYQVGEVFDGDIDFVAGYQGTAVDATLAYPLFFTLRNVFMSGQSANQIQSYYQAAKVFPDQSILGTFIDNQDNSRFLQNNHNYNAFKNALVFMLLADGIPIVYYGDEQGYWGGNDPNNREVLWTNLKNTDSEMYKFVSQVVHFRKSQEVWNYPQIQRYSDNNFYSFSRGKVLAAFSNTTTNLSTEMTYIPYSEGETACNIFYASDCVTVTNGKFLADLNGGEVKIFVPQSSLVEKTIEQIPQEEPKFLIDYQDRLDPDEILPHSLLSLSD